MLLFVRERLHCAETFVKSLITTGLAYEVLTLEFWKLLQSASKPSIILACNISWWYMRLCSSMK